MVKHFPVTFVDKPARVLLEATRFFHADRCSGLPVVGSSRTATELLPKDFHGILHVCIKDGSEQGRIQ